MWECRDPPRPFCLDKPSSKNRERICTPRTLFLSVVQEGFQRFKRDQTHVDTFRIPTVPSYSHLSEPPPPYLAGGVLVCKRLELSLRLPLHLPLHAIARCVEIKSDTNMVRLCDGGCGCDVEDEKQHIFFLSRGDVDGKDFEEEVWCDDCTGQDWKALKARGWVQDDDPEWSEFVENDDADGRGDATSTTGFTATTRLTRTSPYTFLTEAHFRDQISFSRKETETFVMARLLACSNVRVEVLMRPRSIVKLHRLVVHVGLRMLRASAVSRRKRFDDGTQWTPTRTLGIK